VKERKDFIMNKTVLIPTFYALTAALLFGLSTPLNKLLLNTIEPLVLSGLIYLGSGLGILIYRLIKEKSLYTQTEANLQREEIPVLVAAVLAGGVLAPIILLYSIRITPASTASLLLSFEGIATTLLAGIWFGEYIGKRVWLAIAIVTLATMLLSVQWSQGWGFTIGAFGVIAACFMWGLDNNLTRNLSTRDPLLLVFVKGCGAGGFSLLLARFFNLSFPSFQMILIAMAIGVVSYGLSIVFFILSLRSLGSSRTTALYSIAPFAGSLLSFLILGEQPQRVFYLSFPLILVATLILLTETHSHQHLHNAYSHDHRHSHWDGHHNHIHPSFFQEKDIVHSHLHEHEEMVHDHQHLPDIHHRHQHKK
jgi:drug/metabolite transporter (DMT)-like permease